MQTWRTTVDQATAIAMGLVRAYDGGFGMKAAVCFAGRMLWVLDDILNGEITAMLREANADALTMIACCRAEDDPSAEEIWCIVHPRHRTPIVSRTRLSKTAVGEYESCGDPRFEKADNVAEKIFDDDRTIPPSYVVRAKRMLEDKEAILRDALNHAAFDMHAHGMFPALSLVTAGKETYCVLCPYAAGLCSKEKATAELAKLVAAFNADSVLSVAEACGSPLGECRPSAHPERKEVLAVSLVTRDRLCFSAVADIQRKSDGSFAGIGDVETSQSLGISRLSMIFDKADALKLSRAERRRLRGEIVRHRIKAPQPVGH